MSAAGGLVSIIIPVRNGARFLADALASAAGQTGAATEILVVDDGSDDDSAEIVLSYDRARLIRRSPGGAGAARNTGLEKSGGDFIAFLDADDLWRPDKTARQLEALQLEQDAGGVLCRFRNFVDPRFPPPPAVDPARFLSEDSGRMPSLVSLLARRSTFERVGPFRTDLETGEDLDWFTRAADMGFLFPRRPEILVDRRLHDANLSYRAPRDSRHLLEIFKTSVRRKREAEAAPETEA